MSKRNGRPVEDLPPDNLEAERGLLRSLFALPDAMSRPEIVAVLPTDFVDPAHCTVFRHLLGSWLDGRSPEVLAARMKAADDWNDDTKAVVFDLLKLSVSGADAVYFADEVREAAEQRKLWALNRDLAQQIKDRLPSEDIKGFISATLETIHCPGGKRFKKISAAELDAMSDDVPYIVPNVLAEAQPCLCVGGSKMLKTTVLVDLVLSAAWGDAYFLGYFPVRKACRAWFVSGESGDATIKETARRIARAAGRSLPETRDWWYTATLPRLSDRADVAELGREIKRDGINLLVLDPAYLMLNVGGREGSVFAVGPQLAKVAEVCTANGCTPIIVHHATQQKAKTKDYSPPTLNDASWAGFEQFARQWILLGRREAYVEGTGEHRLWLSTGGSAGHGGLYHLDVSEGTRATPGGRFWETTVTPAGEASKGEAERRAEVQAKRDWQRTQDNAQKIMTALRRSPAGDTARGIREATSLNSASFADAISRLLDSGDVVRCSVKKNRTEHDGYKLTDPQKVRLWDTVGHGGITGTVPA